LGGLVLASLIVTATHPILDWTNSYGVRFFLPWSSKWFYGDLVYIVDPYLWLILGGACFLLSAKTRSGKLIWGALAVVLTALVIVSPRAGVLPSLFVVLWVTAIAILLVLFRLHVGRRWGGKVAFYALWFVAIYWWCISFVQQDALVTGVDQAQAIVKPKGETISRKAAMPTLANPFRWDFVFETDRATYRFNVDVLSEATAPARVVRYEKPSGPLADVMEDVSQERPVRIFLGFARFPVAQLADPNCTAQTLVQLSDLRYTEPGRSRGTFTLEMPVECPTNNEGGR
jgi:inner membrane protein